MRYADVHIYAVDRAFTRELIGMIEARLTVPNVSLYSALDAVQKDLRASRVMLMDVLEHVLDDHDMLRSVVAHPGVTAQTRLPITVPAYAALYCAQDRFPGHLRRGEWRAQCLASILACGGRLAVAMPARGIRVPGLSNSAICRPSA